VTLTLPQARPLSGDQRRAVERARDFLRAAVAGQRTLTAHLDAGAVCPSSYADSGRNAALKHPRSPLNMTNSHRSHRRRAAVLPEGETPEGVRAA